jgi:mannose-6-phosphate isomerase-like protein (cupin superfamily)
MDTFAKTAPSLAHPPPHPQELRNQFAEQGYVGPMRVLSLQDCHQFLQAAGDGSKDPPLDWDKGRAASSRAFYEFATNPAIVDTVGALLGDHVMLWGASIQTRPPGAIHPWHSDIESSLAPIGTTVSVWLGIQHTTAASSLSLISHSHRFGVSVQELRQESGMSRDAATEAHVARWAQERDPRSHLIKVEMTDGDALFFDGRLWHATQNLFHRTRHALLLQYATPETMIRIPDLNYLNWPFQQLSQPKPPCIMVRGSAPQPGVNRIISAPVAGSVVTGPQLTSRIYPLRLPLTTDEQQGWRPHPFFRGSTSDVRSMSCHASVLTHGSCPHPPHTHEEEELLLLLTGEVDLVLPAAPSPNGGQRRRLNAGQLVYYPAHFPHTLETVSTEPANYLMFKWRTGKAEIDAPLGFCQFNIFDSLNDSDTPDGFCCRTLFAGPTAYLRKLQCHTSSLTPGAGYDPHIDAYDVAIIVLEGEVETLGERVTPHYVIFYPAGEPHGMRNPGHTIAKYIVFEFHGSQKKLDDSDSLPRPPSRLAKLRDPQAVKRRLKRLARDILERLSPSAEQNHTT